MRQTADAQALETREGHHKRKARSRTRTNENNTRVSLSCCRKKQHIRKVEARKGSRSKHGKRSKKSRSKSRSKKRHSRNGKGRRSRRRHSRHRKKSKSKSRSKGSKMRRRSKKSKRSKKRKSRTSQSKKGTSAKKEKILRENRKLLIKSQSLAVPAKDRDKKASKAEESSKDSTLVNFDTKITAYSPMKKDKKTKLSDDLQFQPLRSPDYREHKKKKENDSPSTAIDIDSSIRMSRPKSERIPAIKEPTIKPYKRKVERKQEEERLMRQRGEEPPFEPAAQRISDLVPIEEAVDRDYPAQRIVISNFVRKGCHVKRWLYEDSYPVDGPRPAISDMMNSQRHKSYSKCFCGRKKVCDGSCEKELSAKQKRFGSGSIENERIREELQRLDLILKNLDD